MLPACRRDDAPTRAVRDRDRSRDGLWVDDVWRNFARDVAESIWPGEDLRTLGSQLGASRQRAVEALAASPEVRLAFVRFKELCRPGRLEPSRGQLRELLASLLPRLHDEYKREGASSASSTVYENGDWASDRHAGARGGDEDPGLRGAAMHFLLQVEAWPRSQQQRRLRDWSFGGRSAEGLAAVLLQLWALDDEACLETEEAVDEQRWTELWGEWLQQHPPLPEAEAEGEAAAGPAGRDVVVVVVLEDDGLDAADEQRRRLLRRGDEGHRGRPCGNALGTDQGVGCGRGRSVSRHTSPVMPLSCHQLGRVCVCVGVRVSATQLIRSETSRVQPRVEKLPSRLTGGAGHLKEPLRRWVDRAGPLVRGVPPLKLSRTNQRPLFTCCCLLPQPSEFPSPDPEAL